MTRRLLALPLAAALLAGCSGGQEPAAAVRASAPASASASAPPSLAPSSTLWLCRPGLPRNPCEGGLDARLPAGQVEEFAPAPDPPVDCFYVYPTVSRVTALNAPAAVDPSLVAVARAQAARFGEVCRVFAPVYRQITLSGIFTGHYEDTGPRALAERDVELAWQDYLARDNDGRGVVLIGHSQGARTLQGLLATTIEPDDAVHERVVSALLLGGGLTVPTGEDVGGTLARTPACREPAQTGCVVAYSAFAAPPPAGSIFGRTTEPGREVLCVDPSRLAGDDGALHPYLPTASLASAGALAATVPGLRTGFAAYPEQLRAQCRREGGASYLQVDLAPGAQLQPPAQPLGPKWGLHNGDVNLALGDLVEVVRQQAEAYQGEGE